MAPAKINVTLEILARRPDGFHTLRSVMLPIGLYDRIELEPASANSFRANDPALAAADNLVARALAAAGLETAFAASLHKGIPVGGGLGGGSSDAAAVLRAAMAGELGVHHVSDWIAVARRLGSDVPFFLSATGALVEGTGERVTPIGALPEWWVLVAQPHAAVATAEAYRRVDAARDEGRPGNVRPRARSASLEAVDAVQRCDFAALTAALSNDFHDIVLRAFPEIARADAALRAAGADSTLLSGSGSCIFALFEREDAARRVTAEVDMAAVRALFTVPLHRDPGWR